MIFVVNRHTGHPHGRASVYVGRGNPLGNPEHLKNEADRDANLARYEIWLRRAWIESADVKRELLRLATVAKREDLVLICSCKPRRCHADFIKHAIEQLIAKEVV
jgi:hypothetical protein